MSAPRTIARSAAIFNELQSRRLRIAELEAERDTLRAERDAARREAACPCCKGGVNLAGETCSECHGKGLVCVAYEILRVHYKLQREQLDAAIAQRDALLGHPEAVHVGALAAIEALRQCQQITAQRDRLLSTWRCFNCGYETADRAEAAAHFGDNDEAETLCLTWARMTTEGRAAEYQSCLQELNGERTENIRLLKQVECLEYRCEVSGADIAQRFKGARTITEAWQQFDSMEGRALAAEESRDAAIAQRDQLAEALRDTRALICESGFQCCQPLDDGECGDPEECLFHGLVSGIDAALALDAQPQAASVIREPRYWLIQFEDPEHGSEMFTDEHAARARFAEVLQKWNCHLFVEADEPPPLSKAELASVQAAPAVCPECGGQRVTPGHNPDQCPACKGTGYVAPEPRCTGQESAK